MRSDDDVEALREVHRIASDRIDERPDARVRAAVLAAAARGVDARPRSAQTQTSERSAPGPSRARRWPLSAAALLVVSVLTGMIATRVLRDSPEPITTLASSAPAPPVEASTEAQTGTGPASPPAATAPARTERPKAALDESRRREAPRSVRPAAPAPTPPAAPAVQMAAPARALEAPTEVRAKAEAGASPNDSVDAPSEEATARQAGTSGVRAATTSSATHARIGRAAEPATPEAWIERIVKLRADGNDVEADRELDALRRRYPGFGIPAGALKSTSTP